MKQTVQTAVLLLGAFALSGCSSIQVRNANRLSVRKLKTETVHEIDFRDAHVWDAVEFFNCAHLDDDEPVDPATQTVLVLPATATNKVPLITLQAHQLSLYRSLQTLADLTDMKFSIEDGRPWLRYDK